MNCSEIRFSRHAIQRMFERKIEQSDVNEVLQNGITIEEYLDDIPFPSRLLLGWSGKRPLHVVIAQDPMSSLCVVITTYIPEVTFWENDFKRRLSP